MYCWPHQGKLGDSIRISWAIDNNGLFRMVQIFSIGSKFISLIYYHISHPGCLNPSFSYKKFQYPAIYWEIVICRSTQFKICTFLNSYLYHLLIFTPLFSTMNLFSQKLLLSLFNAFFTVTLLYLLHVFMHCNFGETMKSCPIRISCIYLYLRYSLFGRGLTSLYRG